MMSEQANEYQMISSNRKSCSSSQQQVEMLKPNESVAASNQINNSDNENSTNSTWSNSRGSTSRRAEATQRLNLVIPQTKKNTLTTPTIITTEPGVSLLNNSEHNLQQVHSQANHTQATSQLLLGLDSHLAHLNGQVGEVSLFTGVPSCTPTSADRLTNINPFFWGANAASLTSGIKQANGNTEAIGTNQAATGAYQTNANDGPPASNNQQQATNQNIARLQVESAQKMDGPNGGCRGQKYQMTNLSPILLSPLSLFGLSPEQEAWLRAVGLSPNQHPLAGKTATQADLDRLNAHSANIIYNHQDMANSMMMQHHHDHIHNHHQNHQQHAQTNHEQHPSQVYTRPEDLTNNQSVGNHMNTRSIQQLQQQQQQPPHLTYNSPTVQSNSASQNPPTSSSNLNQASNQTSVANQVSSVNSHPVNSTRQQPTIYTIDPHRYQRLMQNPFRQPQQQRPPPPPPVAHIQPSSVSHPNSQHHYPPPQQQQQQQQHQQQQQQPAPPSVLLISQIDHINSEASQFQSNNELAQNGHNNINNFQTTSHPHVADTGGGIYRILQYQNQQNHQQQYTTVYRDAQSTQIHQLSRSMVQSCQMDSSLSQPDVGRVTAADTHSNCSNSFIGSPMSSIDPRAASTTLSARSSATCSPVPPGRNVLSGPNANEPEVIQIGNNNNNPKSAAPPEPTAIGVTSDMAVDNAIAAIPEPNNQVFSSTSDTQTSTSTTTTPAGNATNLTKLTVATKTTTGKQAGKIKLATNAACDQTRTTTTTSAATATQINSDTSVVVIKKKSKGGRKKKLVTHEEMLARKNRSKERNRVAAKRCRQKRKQFLDTLRDRIDALNTQNNKLQRENSTLKGELESLKRHHEACGK